MEVDFGEKFKEIFEENFEERFEGIWKDNLFEGFLRILDKVLLNDSV